MGNSLFLVDALFQFTGIISIFVSLCDRHQDAILFSLAGD